MLQTLQFVSCIARKSFWRILFDGLMQPCIYIWVKSLIIFFQVLVWPLLYEYHILQNSNEYYTLCSLKIREIFGVSHKQYQKTYIIQAVQVFSLMQYLWMKRLAGQETFSNFFIIKLFLLAQHLQTSLQFHNKYFIIKPHLFLNNINIEPNSATD